MKEMMMVIIIIIIINQKAFDSFPHSWMEKSIELVDFVNYLWRNGTQGFIHSFRYEEEYPKGTLFRRYFLHNTHSINKRDEQS